MRPEWKLSTSLLFFTVIMTVSKVIFLSGQADSHYLTAQWFPTASDKAQLIKWYRMFSMMWPLAFSRALFNPHWAPGTVSISQVLQAHIANSHLCFIVASLTQKTPGRVKPGFGPPPWNSLSTLRSPWSTLPSILKEWTYEWIGLSWECVILVRGSSGCNNMGSALIRPLSFWGSYSNRVVHVFAWNAKP